MRPPTDLKGKQLYDFYLDEDGSHFAREEMTEDEAVRYALRYDLTFDVVNNGGE